MYATLSLALNPKRAERENTYWRYTISLALKSGYVVVIYVEAPQKNLSLNVPLSWQIKGPTDLVRKSKSSGRKAEWEQTEIPWRGLTLIS